jgi:hypothetical protein
MLEVSQIKRAYEQAIGRSVPSEDRLSNASPRHPWHKIGPRRHPEVNRGRAFKNTPSETPLK